MGLKCYIEGQNQVGELKIVVMEQWFNLLIQVAQPILTTLAYTGTNILLDTVQSEITDRQNKQARLALKSLGFTEQNAALSQQIIQKTGLIFESDAVENNSIVQPQRLVNGYPSITKQDLLAQISQETQENALKLP